MQKKIKSFGSILLLSSTLVFCNNSENAEAQEKSAVKVQAKAKAKISVKVKVQIKRKFKIKFKDGSFGKAEAEGNTEKSEVEQLTEEESQKVTNQIQTEQTNSENTNSEISLSGFNPPSGEISQQDGTQVVSGSLAGLLANEQATLYLSQTSQGPSFFSKTYTAGPLQGNSSGSPVAFTFSLSGPFYKSNQFKLEASIPGKGRIALSNWAQAGESSPPQIQVITPVDAETGDTAQRLSGMIIDQNIDPNGARFQLTRTGSWNNLPLNGSSFDYPITLTTGNNPILVEAKDKFGNIGTAELNIYVNETLEKVVAPTGGLTVTFE